MKIAWFTPFSQKSAISKYSQAVTNELIKHCNVDLWLAEDENLLPTNLNIVRYRSDSDVSKKLKDYNYVVYNMGNYLDYHRDIYEVSLKTKGIVIVHDFVMHHFFAGYYLLHKKDRDAYMRNMEILYGADGRRCALDSMSGARAHVWETDEVANYPFFEKAVEVAEGVIAHSHFHGNAVKQKYLGPVTVLHHPFDSRHSVGNAVRKDVLGLREDTVLLLTVGYVNPNKRIDRILKALGENPAIARTITYVIIGPCEDGEYLFRLKTMVKQYGLDHNVRFLGFQPDDALYSYMAAADGFINLRFPAMEGASWSLVEELHFGKPVMVSDTGCYSELPDDCVLKIRTDREEDEAILGALRKLASQDQDMTETGDRGRAYAHATFTASQYCKGFLKFLDEVGSWKPVLGLIDRVSHEFSLMGVHADFTVIDKVALETYYLFEEPDNP